MLTLQKVVNVSNEVKTALQEKLNLQADTVIQDLEEKFGKNEVIACINYVYNKTVIGKQQPIKSTKYLVSTFEMVLIVNVVVIVLFVKN